MHDVKDVMHDELRGEAHKGPGSGLSQTRPDSPLKNLCKQEAV